MQVIYPYLMLIPFLFYAGSGIGTDKIFNSLSPKEEKMINDFGFFARKSNFKKFSELYKSLKEKNLPIYVTTDGMLHTYHILYDFSLRSLEVNHLYPEVCSLTEAMIQGTKDLLRKYPEETHTLLNNLAYLEVAEKLLKPDYCPDGKTGNIVKKEMALINSGKGFAKSPIFGYKEDYSQYKPRGHYTRSEILKRYFRAMMWFGRMGFRLKPEKESTNRKGRAETKMALMILEALNKNLEQWKRLNTPITLYIGKSDDLTPIEYLQIINENFPGKTPAEIARDERLLMKFINEAITYRPPKIISTAVPDTLEPEVVTKGFKFFGQKFIPDSYMFQELVYKKVGTQEDPRLFPRGLDVLAVLGSKRARNILVEHYKENRFSNYESQLDNLIKEFQALKQEDWYKNLYYGWLYALKSLIKPVPKFQPAYQDKCLQTALGSWAELRHDTILYAKQSYTMELTAVRSKPRLTASGYVEPIPECFERLKKLVDMSQEELSRLNILDDYVKAKFNHFSEILGSLKRITEDELKNRELTEEQQSFIRNIGEVLEALETFPAVDYKTETDESNALCADVHTDPNTKKVLEVANDIPAYIYVLINTDAGPKIFIGGIYDYYEFTQPLSKRLTDEEWQKLSPKPEKPSWIKFFVQE